MDQATENGFVRPRTLAPPEPPACPRGWVTAPPDFVGVGAQRCGTTWWHRQIFLHPQVVSEAGVHRKEVHFFDSLSGVDVLSPEQVEMYARYFPRPPSGGVTGEWTPRYLFDPWVPRLLAQAAPRARLLVILRDPVDRYVSGVRWESRLAAERPRWSGLTRERIDAGQRSRGFYAEQVERLLEAFARDQVLILQYERCRAHYEEELERTYEFLGLETSARPAPAVNRPQEPKGDHVEGVAEAELARAYAADVRRLIEIAPEIDVSLWPNVRDLV